MSLNAVAQALSTDYGDYFGTVRLLTKDSPPEDYDYESLANSVVGQIAAGIRDRCVVFDEEELCGTDGEILWTFEGTTTTEADGYASLYGAIGYFDLPDSFTEEEISAILENGICLVEIGDESKSSLGNRYVAILWFSSLPDDPSATHAAQFPACHVWTGNADSVNGTIDADYDDDGHLYFDLPVADIAAHVHSDFSGSWRIGKSTDTVFHAASATTVQVGMSDETGKYSAEATGTDYDLFKLRIDDSNGGEIGSFSIRAYGHGLSVPTGFGGEGFLGFEREEKPPLYGKNISGVDLGEAAASPDISWSAEFSPSLYFINESSEAGSPGGGGGLSTVATDSPVSGDGSSSDPVTIVDEAITEPKLSISNSPSDGQILAWDATNGLTWENEGDPGSGGGTVNTALPISGDGSAGDPVTIANASIANEKVISVNASKLTGTIADARIPASIARDSELPDVSDFIESSDVKVFAQTGGRNVESGDITSLVASKLTGIIADARIPASVARDSEIPDVSSFIESSDVKIFARTGGRNVESDDITSLVASKLTGTIADDRIPSSIARDSEIPTTFSQLGGTIATSDIANDTVTPAKISTTGSTDGQVLTSTGASSDPAWEDLPASPDGGLQSVSTSDPVSGDGTPGNPVTIVDGGIGADQLANAAVTDAKIATVASSKLTGDINIARIPNTIARTSAISGLLNQSEVDARVTTLVEDWSEVGNSTKIPDGKIPDGIARDSEIPNVKVFALGGERNIETGDITNSTITEVKLAISNSPIDGNVLGYTDDDGLLWVGQTAGGGGSGITNTVLESTLDMFEGSIEFLDPIQGDDTTRYQIGTMWRIKDALMQDIDVPPSSESNWIIVSADGSAWVRISLRDLRVLADSDDSNAIDADVNAYIVPGIFYGNVDFTLSELYFGLASDGSLCVGSTGSAGTVDLRIHRIAYTDALDTVPDGSLSENKLNIFNNPSDGQVLSWDSTDGLTWKEDSSGTNGITNVATDSTITGDGTIGDVLSLANSAVTAAKIASGAVTNDKIATVDASKLTGTIDDARIPASIARDSEIPDVADFIESTDVKIFARTGGRNIESGDMTSLDAVKLTGSILDARIPATIARDSELPAANRLVPAGGEDGQILKKSSDDDYETAWEDGTAVGGGASFPAPDRVFDFSNYGTRPNSIETSGSFWLSDGNMWANSVSSTEMVLAAADDDDDISAYMENIQEKTLISARVSNDQWSSWRVTEAPSIQYEIIGTVPEGVYFDSASRILRGTPREIGSFPVVLRATANGTVTEESFDIVIAS